MSSCELLASAGSLVIAVSLDALASTSKRSSTEVAATSVASADGAASQTEAPSEASKREASRTRPSEAPAEAPSEAPSDLPSVGTPSEPTPDEAQLGPDCVGADCAADCIQAHGGSAVCSQGVCQLPTFFTCGDTTCRSDQFCVTFLSDFAGNEDIHTCMERPAACEPGATNCECLDDPSVDLDVETCLSAGSCEVGDAGEMWLSCPGG